MDTPDKTISTWTHKASFWLTFLLPIFLICFSIPLSGVSLNALKSSVLIIATSLALIFSLIDKINKKDLDVRISIGGLLGFVFCIIILLASFSSSTPILSLFGNGVEEPSGLTLISIVVFSFLFSRYHGNNINRFFSIFLFSYIFSTLFSVVFFVFPNFFNLTQGFNLFGGLNSFAIVSSFVLSLAILFFENKKENRLLSLVAILTSFFVLIFLNSRFCFILTAILIAFVFFKNFIFSKEIKFPGVSFLMLTIFIFFIFGKPIIGDFFPNIINLKSSEISPSFESSYLVLKDQLKESPFLGVGPARFLDSWMKYQPENVIQTPFWNRGFYSGQNSLFYLGVTLGITGLAAFIVLILYSLFLYFKNITKNNELSRNIEQLFFLASFFIILFFSLDISILLFCFVGIFFNLNTHDRIFVLENNSIFKKRFILVFISLGLFFGVALFVFGFLKFTGLVLTERAEKNRINSQDFLKTQIILDKAIKIFPNFVALEGDLFLKKQIIFKEIDGSNSADLQIAIDNSFLSAKKLMNYNSNSYFAWSDIGSYFSELTRFDVENARDVAQFAFEQAKMLSPKNPTPELMLGRLFLMVGDFENAREYLNNSIKIKNNYSEPYIYLGILEEKNGNYSIAESSYQKALSLNLSERGFVNLGNFYLRSGDLINAKESYIRAIALSSNINQNYLTLAMIYSGLGENKDAVDLLGMMIKKYPNDKILQNTLQKINTGESFDNVLLNKEIIIP